MDSALRNPHSNKLTVPCSEIREIGAICGPTEFHLTLATPRLTGRLMANDFLDSVPVFAKFSPHA